MDHTVRIERLQAGLEHPILVSALVNIRYLTGFTGTSASLIVTPESATFVTDGRYAEMAADLVALLPDTELVVQGPNLIQSLAGILDGAEELGVEADHVPWSFARNLKATLPHRVVPTRGIVERLRRIKDDAEVAALQRAASAGDAAFARLDQLLAQAATEGALGDQLVGAMRDAGADAAGWPPIVAMGANAARPHHRAGTGSIADGLLLMDYGCVVDGYHSDMTRTVWLGAHGDQEMEAIHAAVLAANEAGIAAVGPGVRAHDVDEACRAVLRDRGFEEHFLHSTGHGVGLEIHEAPWVKRDSEDILEPGDVVTVEPGVYLPGRGGVRIEDMVLVTRDGREVLTTASKDLRLGGRP